MNNKMAIVIGCTIVLIGTYFFLRQAPQKKITQVTPASADTAQQSTSRYLPYTKERFDSLASKKRVYFFHAPWCPTCIPADRAFQANQASIPEDVILFKTDYDSSDSLKKQYAITYQHTFVLVDENGTEIKKWNGGGLEELIVNTQ
jgi:thioredoxin 1